MASQPLQRSHYQEVRIMNKSILSLIIFGVALAVVCMPDAMLTVGIILGLAIATIQLSWHILQAFSSASEHRLLPPLRNRPVIRRKAA
jgi:hypothetical protein